jgi:hypothetical protein
MKTRLAACFVLATCEGAFAENATPEFPRTKIDRQPLPLLDAARDRLPPVFTARRQTTFVSAPDVSVEVAKLRQQLEPKLKRPQDLPRM